MSEVIEIDLRPFSGQAKREPLERRTGSAVRRRSKAAGGEKGTPVTWTQRRLRLDAFDKLARERRQAGQRWGAKGTFSRHDREILAQLLAIAARHRGQVFPTIQEIAHRVGCTLRSVVNGLKRLKSAGFVEWDRRYVETGQSGLRGPQVEQTSNFYYLPLPTTAAALIELWRKARAPRETEAQEHERQAQQERSRAWKQEADRQAWLSKLKPGSPFHRAQEKAARELAALKPEADTT